MKPATPPSTAFAVATLGIAVFSSMDAVMKGLALAIGAYNALLWRSLAGTLITGALFLATRARWPTRAVLRVHLVRGGVSAVMAMLFFWGLARVPMAQAIALAFVAPLIALLLAALVLKERIGRGAVLASVVALAGVAVIFLGQARAALGPEATIGSLAVLASAVCYAWNIILMRQQAMVARPVEIAFFQSAIVSILFLLAAPVFGAVPDAGHAPMLILAAALATASLMLLSWAYARGRASDLAPSEYTGFVWASLFGWIVFSENLSFYTLAGAMLIILACILSARAAPPLETNL
ncbi:DMT family transporter [Sphingomonas sp. CA1-15]|uniref:DMT family transporter n=1 Tax=Sphingomonas immobilis TaxID=3063997 RepID=A0ABT9A274_9SPHN|nr:DMT family transporter [Sphingomonas sp. CA1-15]MDO7843941.1 DMT family transporter [Sphingomonas sp. CA1-15]